MSTVTTAAKAPDAPPAAGPAPSDGGAPPLSVRLREETRAAHERAEGSSFVGALMGGRLGVAAYADLAAQHHTVYTALEEVEETVRGLPGGGSVVFEELRRTAAIERDLAHLVGPDWRARVRVLPAAARYAAHLRDVAAGWVGGYAAHAYTRYLGDLSGGLAVKAILQRTYGIPDEGVQFYTFPGIPKPKPFKDLYRERLDALPLDAVEADRVVAEAGVAFELNTALFADLASVHLP